MRNIIFALISVMMWSQINEHTTAAENLEQTEASAAIDSYQSWYWKGSNLDGRIPRVHGNLDCGSRCSRRDGTKGSDYNGLRPDRSRAYDGLAVRRPGSKGGTSQTEEASISKTVIINNIGASTSVTESQFGWVPPKAHHHECPCRGECNCPPLVCKQGKCKSNYIVLFASNTCEHCKRMWPVIRQLRKEGYTVVYLEVQSHPQIVEQFDLTLYPTAIVFEGGKQTVRFNGAAETKSITEFAKKDSL